MPKLLNSLLISAAALSFASCTSLNQDLIDKNSYKENIKYILKYKENYLKAHNKNPSDYLSVILEENDYLDVAVNNKSEPNDGFLELSIFSHPNIGITQMAYVNRDGILFCLFGEGVSQDKDEEKICRKILEQTVSMVKKRYDGRF